MRHKLALLIGASLGMLAMQEGNPTNVYAVARKNEEDKEFDETLKQLDREYKERLMLGDKIDFPIIKQYPSIPKQDQKWRKPYKSQGSKFIPHTNKSR